MTRKTASTHHTESLEQKTAGKRYYVIDDAKTVWIADVDYKTAAQRKEIVAGRRWSKTPTIKEMPANAEYVTKIIAAAGGATLDTPPRAATALPAPAIHVASPPLPPPPAAPLATSDPGHQGGHMTPTATASVTGPGTLQDDAPADPEPDPLAEELEGQSIDDILGRSPEDGDDGDDGLGDLIA